MSGWGQAPCLSMPHVSYVNLTLRPPLYFNNQFRHGPGVFTLKGCGGDGGMGGGTGALCLSSVTRILRQSLDALRLLAEGTVGSRQVLDRWSHCPFSFVQLVTAEPSRGSQTHLWLLHLATLSLGLMHPPIRTLCDNARCLSVKGQNNNRMFTLAVHAFFQSHNLSVLQFYHLVFFLPRLFLTTINIA